MQYISQIMEPENQLSHTKNSFKIKLAFFFGYNGEKFQGMQYQRQHQNTIQNILHKVLVDNRFILPSNANQLKKIKWSRAARTDKRVHALCNGISMKIEIGERYVLDRETKQVNYDRIIKDLNDELPRDICILAIRRVGKSFDMRHDAKTRIYNYIIPSRLFQPIDDFKNNKSIEKEQLETIIEKLNNLVKFYIGTHNFYNFTRGYKQTDPQCVRFMISMVAEQVEPSTIEGILDQCHRPQSQYNSFIRFTLVGQSFIYHQIRKMIGLLVKIFSQQLDGQETIKKAFNPQQYDVYLAPGEGLYLNRMTFQSYNNRRDTKQKIQFTEEEDVRIKKYRAYLQSKIIKHEVQERVFSEWITKRGQWQNRQDQQIEQSQPEAQKEADSNEQDNGKGKNKGKWKNFNKNKGKGKDKKQQNADNAKKEQNVQEGQKNDC